MRRFLLIIAVLLSSIGMFSQPRSEQQAKQIASEFFNKRPQRKAPALSVVPQQNVSQTIRKKVARAQKSPSKHNSCYVINDEANNRFVIVSADERMYEILGYSENGCFDAEKAPEGLLEVMDGYALSYEFLMSHQDAKLIKRVSSVKEIEPLITTKWDQGEPYNNDCPEDPSFAQYSELAELLGLSTKSVTGCVATAMAQVMNYHKYPESGQGIVSYKTRSYGIPQYMNFSSVKFDWANMSDTYSEVSTEEQKRAVSQLMHACGNSVVMDYSAYGSGAYNYDMAYALIHYFKYNPNIRHYEKIYFTTEEWLNLIYRDLESKRPVIYTGIGEKVDEDGNTSRYGHAFVIHGCDSEGRFMINWGYSGEYDGYYELTALEFDDSNYNLEQAMVCNISPERNGDSEDMFFANMFVADDWLNNSSVGRYGSASLEKVFCYSVNTNTYREEFDGEIGIGLYDSNHNFIKSLAKRNIEDWGAAVGASKVPFTWKYDAETFKFGTRYNIAPYAKAKNSEAPTLMRTTYAVSDAYNIETTDDGTIIVRLGWYPSKPIPEIREGRYAVSAFNFTDSRKEWTVNITKGADQSSYLISGIDPAQGSESDNQVVAIQNEMGNLVISVEGQNLGGNRMLHNYSSAENIIISVARDGQSMAIDDAWGVVDKDTGYEYSRFTKTEFKYKDIDEVVPPAISIDKEHLMTITCATEPASIYYTFTEKGEEPQCIASNLYIKGDTLSCNGVVRAFAIMDGTKSNTVSRTVDDFKVTTPNVTLNGNWIVIDCDIYDSIYYTLDGSSPSAKNGIKYTEPFPCPATTTTIKVIAVRSRWHDSDIRTYYHVVDPDPDVVVNDNVAGELPLRIPNATKMEVTSLTIAGKLNGTDIACIREMLANGKLAYLNIQNADIVSGGEPYYKGGESELLWEYTEDDVIGSHMFSWSKNLASIKLPNTAKIVGMYSLSHCDNLKSVSLPEACTSVLYNAISECDLLETVHIPASVKDFDGTNLTDCNNLKSVTVDVENKYYKSVDGVLFTKDGSILIKYPAGIEESAYTIPNGVTTIGDHAFASTSLVNVQFPEGLKKIENSAFSWCDNLKSATLPNTVESVGMFAFNNCRELSTVRLSQMLTAIKYNAFSNCTKLREVSFGAKLKEIDGTAFSDCMSLTVYHVDEENPYLTAENGTLYTKDMTVLKSCPTALFAEMFYVPNGVVEIGEHAFSDCRNIGAVELPASVSSIGNSAFSFSSITSINLPEGIKKIPMFAFSNCENLKTAILPTTLKEISTSAFSDCRNMEMVYIPESVDTIDSYAFSGCSSLRTIKCDIREIDKLGVHYDKYVNVGTYTPFLNIPDDCCWIVNGFEDTSALEEEYKKQPWWVPTWNLLNDVHGVTANIVNNNIWYNLQGIHINGVPNQKGLYINNGRKVLVK